MGLRLHRAPLQGLHSASPRCTPAYTLLAPNGAFTGRPNTNLPILTRFASWPLSTGDISRWRNDRIDLFASQLTPEGWPLGIFAIDTWAFSRPLYLYKINSANGVTFIFMQIIFSTYTKKRLNL